MFSQVKTRAQNTPNSRQGEGLIAQRSFFIQSPKREKTWNFKGFFRTPCIDNWRHTAHTVEKRLLARAKAWFGLVLWKAEADTELFASPNTAMGQKALFHGSY